MSAIFILRRLLTVFLLIGADVVADEKQSLTELEQVVEVLPPELLKRMGQPEIPRAPASLFQQSQERLTAAATKILNEKLLGRTATFTFNVEAVLRGATFSPSHTAKDLSISGVTNLIHRGHNRFDGTILVEFGRVENLWEVQMKKGDKLTVTGEIERIEFTHSSITEGKMPFTKLYPFYRFRVLLRKAKVISRSE